MISTKAPTVREALAHGVHELTKAKTHDPEGCARFLLRHVIGTDPSEISILDPQRRLTKEETDRFNDLLEHRRKHEPVWYITNEAYFWKDTFYVDGRVLIPRPETEILVEKVLEFIKGSTPKKWSIVDIGTGAGAIAISLARELTSAPANQITSGLVNSFTRQPVIYAIDISKEAIEVAKLNAERIGVADKIKFLIGDALEPLQEPVDLIVGNPPYVPTETVGGLAYDIHHFEPRVALDGGIDGFDVHRKILAQAKKKLRKHGAIFLEIGHDQGALASKIAREKFPKAKIEIFKDYEDSDRILSIKT